MPEPTLLRTFDNWENGIGHLRDDGSPSLYTSDKILGLRGELRPAPAAAQVTVDTDSGQHFQYFFEESITTGVTPTFDAGASGKADNTTTFSWSHTVSTTKDNQLLLVGVFVDFASGIITPTTNIAYGGKAMTLKSAYSFGGTGLLWVYYLKSPPTGTNTIFVSWFGEGASNPATDAVGLSSSWYNVDQNGPFGNLSYDNTVNDAGPATVDVTSSTSEVVVDFTMSTDTVTTLTKGAGQTEVTANIAQDDIRGGCSYETGAATTTMSWALGGATDWSSVAFALVGAKPGPSYLYAQRGKKAGTSSTVKVNKVSLSNYDFANLETGNHDLTPLTVPGQPVRYQGYWWFPMGDTQKPRKLTTVGTGAVSNDALAATATPFADGGDVVGIDHFANLNHQIVCTAESGSNPGGVRIVKEDGDLDDASHYGSAFQVGDKSERAAGVSSLMGLSFVLNVEGLYSFNATGRSGMVFEDFRTWRHVFDNISIKPWKQGLLLSHPTGLLYYTPGQLPINVGIDISPAEAAIAPSGPPALRGGRYHGTAPIGDFVPAIYQPDLNSSTVNVLIGYPTKNNPESLVWQHLATTELQDTDHMLGCFVTVGSKPNSAEYITPTL